MKKIFVLIGLIVLSIASYGQTMWDYNSLVEDTTNKAITLYYGKVNPEYHYTFTANGQTYALAYRANDNWRKQGSLGERGLLLYRYRGTGKWEIASDVICVDYATAIKSDKLVYAGYPNKMWDEIQIKEDNTVIIYLKRLFLHHEPDKHIFSEEKYYKIRIVLAPIGYGQYRLITSEKLSMQ